MAARAWAAVHHARLEARRRLGVGGAVLAPGAVLAACLPRLTVLSVDAERAEMQITCEIAPPPEARGGNDEPPLSPHESHEVRVRVSADQP